MYLPVRVQISGRKDKKLTTVAASEEENGTGGVREERLLNYIVVRSV